MRFDSAQSVPVARRSQRRLETLIALATGFVALSTAALLITWAGGFGWGLLVGAGLPFITIAAVVAGKIDQYHPHEHFGAANAVTLTRTVINCLLIGLLVEHRTLFAYWGDWADWLFLAAALVSLGLDGIDGFLARRQNLASRFGARFDVEIDALLLTLLAIAAYALGKVGLWVVAIGAAYYIFLAARQFLPWLSRDLPQSMRRKAVCVLQGFVLIALVTPFVHGIIATLLAAFALAALILSFGIDVLWLARRRQA